MRKLFALTVALGVALALTAEGLTASESVAAQTWTGRIRFSDSAIAEHVSSAWFHRNDCSWAGQESLNGFDALFFDLGSHAGLGATLRWSHAGAGLPAGARLQFLTASCEPASDSVVKQNQAGAPMAFTIPALARWGEITIDGRAANDVQVTIESTGTTAGGSGAKGGSSGTDDTECDDGKEKLKKAKKNLKKAKKSGKPAKKVAKVKKRVKKAKANMKAACS